MFIQCSLISWCLGETGAQGELKLHLIAQQKFNICISILLVAKYTATCCLPYHYVARMKSSRNRKGKPAIYQHNSKASTCPVKLGCVNKFGHFPIKRKPRHHMNLTGARNKSQMANS